MLKRIFDFQNPQFRKRVLVMAIGIVIMGLGNCLFRLSMTGSDPSTAFALAVGNTIGKPLSVSLVMTGLIYFLVEIIWGRKYIGIGTFVNWFCVGLLSDLWLGFISKFYTLPESWSAKVPCLLIAVLVLSLSVALYQEADVGIAPYDVLALILDEKLPLPYFWCRMICDASCAILAFLLGGLVGLGTVVCALGLGPFISFFTKHVAKKIL